MIAAWGSLALDTALKSLLLFFLALTAAYCANGAAQRHRVWLLFLGGLLALPYLSAGLPKWQVPFPGSAGTLARPEPEGQRRPMTANWGLRSPGAGKGARAPREGNLSFSPTLPGYVRPAPAEVKGRPRSTPIPLTTLLFGIWITGALLVLGRASLGLFAIAGLPRASHAKVPSPLLEAAREAAAAMGLRRVPQLRLGLPEAPGVAPLTWGYFRPVVLLPADAAEWPAERLRAVLLHECAHVARGDWAAQGLAALAVALYWFHPGAWHAASRLRAEAERACDDQVLARGWPPADYATLLLDVLRALRAPLTDPIGTTMTSAINPFDRSQIEERLKAILDEETDRRTASRAWRHRASAAALGLVALVAAAGYGAASRPERAPRSTPVTAPAAPPASHRLSAPPRSSAAPTPSRPPALAAAAPAGAAPAEAAPTALRAPVPVKPADSRERRSEAAVEALHAQAEQLRARMEQLAAQRAMVPAQAEATARRAAASTSLLQKELDLLENRLADLRVEAVIRPERQRPTPRLQQLLEERAQIVESLDVLVSARDDLARKDRQIAAERERLAQAEQEAAKEREQTIRRLEARRQALLAELQEVTEKQGGEAADLHRQLDSMSRQLAELQEQMQNARAEEQLRLQKLNEERHRRLEERQRNGSKQRDRAKAQAEQARRDQSGAANNLRRLQEKLQRLNEQREQPDASREPATP